MVLGRMRAGVAAGAVVALVMMTTPLTVAGAAKVNAPRLSATYSAYGVQLSVPKSWAVAYFQDCPVPKAAGTLLIGTPSPLTNCVNFGHVNLVWMQPESSPAPSSSHFKHLSIHGLDVKSDSTGLSLVPSKHVVITAMGPEASEVVQTLTTATPRARAAPGMLRGSEYLIALMRTPVTGTVAVAKLGRHGAPKSVFVHAYDAQFWRTFPPGTYVLTGHAGNAPCPPVKVSIESGLVVDAPEIDCQGE